MLRGFAGSLMSNNWMPALKNEYAVKFGSALPGAFMCGGLCEPKRPRLSQNVRYGASAGGTGTGNLRNLPRLGRVPDVDHPQRLIAVRCNRD